MKRKKKHIVWKIAWYTLFAVAAVCICFVLYLKLFVRDIPRIDDSAMAITVKPVPDTENAYLLLPHATFPINDPLYAPGEERLKNAVDKLDKTGSLTAADMKELKFFFKERFLAMKRMAALPYSQARPNYSPEDHIPNYIALRNLARVQLEAAWQDFEAGHRKRARDTVLTMMDVGRVAATEQGGTNLIGLMIGVSIKIHSLETLNRMLSTGWLPKSTETLQSNLAEHRSQPQAWRNVIKGEYKVICYILDNYDKERVYNEAFDESGGLMHFLYGKFFTTSFHKERARKLLFDFYKPILNGMDKPFAQTASPNMDFSMHDYGSFSETIRLSLSGEYSANIIAAVAVPNIKSILARKNYLKFLMDGTRIRIAALAYERDHGALPAALADLSPDYIKEVPSDPFDGKPVRYDSKRGIIYSVGMDGKDQHARGEKDVFSKRGDPGKAMMENKDYVLNIQ